MANLFGTGINQIPTNGMLGNLAFQDKAYVSVDQVGIGSTFVDSGTAGQILQVYGGGAYIDGNVGIGTTNPTAKLDVIGNVRITGISTLGVTSVTNLTAQQLNVSGVSTLGNVTVGSGNTTLIVSGTTRVSGASTFDSAVTFNSGVTVGGPFAFNANASNFNAASQTTGAITLGGPSQTGTQTFGQSTVTNNVNYASGASGVGTTKTINFGTGGLSGSFTQINIGPGPSAGVGTVVINSGTNLGIGTTNPTSKLDVVGDAKVSGVVTATTFIGALTGTATTATKLTTARTFEITGDVVASAISFDGSGNVSLAATIQPNSVALGTDTTGDYVTNITGTSNQITVTGGTGEGSTPTLSIPSQFTAPQDVTVTRDLQVNRNLNVTGNITIGGTTAFINVQQLQVYDQDLVLGFRTDGSGNDVSNDTTANHGGIAVASTEGTPLVSLYNPGIGESTLPTYKKIMWFKSGSFTGLNTDAWLVNYAVGIGSTQFPTGTRLAAGSVQFTENDLAVVRNINASGIITASSFSGNASSATYATNAGVSTYADSAGISTYSTSSGIATYAINAGTSTSVIGGIGSITQLQVSGISTFSGIATHTVSLFGTQASFTGIVTASSFVGSLTGTATSTTNIPNLTGDVTSNNTVTTLATVNSNVGTYGDAGAIPSITVNAKGLVTGVTTVAPNNGQLSLGVSGTGLSGSATFTANQSGSSTFTVTSNATDANTASAIVARDASGNFSAGTITANLTGTATYATNAGTSTSVIGGIASVTQLSVSGISTLGVTSTTNLTSQQLNISGLSTFAGITTHTASLFGTQASFTGVVTALSFSGNASSATYATNAGTSTSVIGGIGSITQLQVTGISTFTNGPVLVSTATSTGTALQPLQVTGGAYVSGSVGVGTTNPGAKLDVLDGIVRVGYQNINSANPPVGPGTITAYGSIVAGVNTAYNSQFAAVGLGTTSGELAIYSFYPNFANFPTDRQPRRAADIIGGYSTGVWGTEYLSFNVGYSGNPNDGGALTVEKARITQTGVGIGTTNPTQSLHVQGNARVTGGFYDSNNNVGTAGSVLSSTGSGLSWVPLTAASGVSVQNQGSTVGTASTINFNTNLTATFSSGVATINVTASSTNLGLVVASTYNMFMP